MLRLGLKQGWAGDKHQVPPGGKVLRQRAQDTSYTSLGPIPLYSVADGFAGSHPDPGPLQVVFKGDQYNQRVGK